MTRATYAFVVLGAALMLGATPAAPASAPIDWSIDAYCRVMINKENEAYLTSGAEKAQCVADEQSAVAFLQNHWGDYPEENKLNCEATMLHLNRKTYQGLRDCLVTAGPTPPAAAQDGATTLYAVRLCDLDSPGRCQLANNGQTYSSLAECQYMISIFTKGRPPKPRFPYDCVKKTVATWEPAQ